MAQVNSEPGVSQVPPTVVVTSKTAEVGTDTPKAIAKATVVPYAQTEVGKYTHTNPLRS
jgi:hypothetical protein